MPTSRATRRRAGAADRGSHPSSAAAGCTAGRSGGADPPDSNAPAGP
jgi:hypothetical protein